MMNMNPEPQFNIAMFLFPLLSAFFYIAVIVFIVLVGVKLLSFMKRKEERDREMLEKLNSIIEKLEK